MAAGATKKRARIEALLADSSSVSSTTSGLQRILHTQVPTVSGLHSLLKDLRGMPDILTASERDIKAALQARFEGMLCTESLPLLDGTTFELEFVDPNLLTARLVAECEQLAAIYSCAFGTGSANETWRVVVAFDEFIPGNKLQTDSGRMYGKHTCTQQLSEGHALPGTRVVYTIPLCNCRRNGVSHEPPFSQHVGFHALRAAVVYILAFYRKVMVVSHSFLNLGQSALSLEACWVPGLIVRSTILHRVVGGWSAVFRLYLRKLFMGQHGLSTVGVPLRLPGRAVLLFGRLTNLLSDGDGLRAGLDWKGHASMKPCLKHANILKKASGFTNDVVQHIMWCLGNTLFEHLPFASSCKR